MIKLSVIFIMALLFWQFSFAIRCDQAAIGYTGFQFDIMKSDYYAALDYHADFKKAFIAEFSGKISNVAQVLKDINQNMGLVYMPGLHSYQATLLSERIAMYILRKAINNGEDPIYTARRFASSLEMDRLGQTDFERIDRALFSLWPR